MSVRHSLLAILAERPAHGYGLKSRFERDTAGIWPLNVGQVYTTLARLERDGLVVPRDDGGGARQEWRITKPGRAALAAWYDAPVAGDPPERDELAIKILLAVATRSADAGRILQNQRTATMRRLQEYTRHRREADPERELPWILLLDAFTLKAEAEIKWLDRCEARLGRRSG
ncbi:MAG: PadR family transcriptional regulator [Candidatus Eisenbacteria bacterium]|nr:PadR family transcriptional regulator [Candidatus Latescibacterota bacterium]MBD3303311.1 PadR family transcriptional regulator [Candidatus Eisenbacteria bacterium]